MAVYFTYIDCSRILYFSFVGIIESLEIIDTSDNFDLIQYEFSWSLDNVSWSAYMTKSEMLQNILDTNQFTNVQIYIRIKITLEKRKTLNQSYYELTSVVLNNTIELVASAIEVPSSSNVLNTQNSKNLFNPYRNFDNQKILYSKMSKSISDIFGFECIYFKTEPLIESEDLVFRTYRLSNVTEYKNLTVVINNNDLPDNKLQFSEYDIDFQDELELHIVKEVFAEQFGDSLPNANDFLYLPLTDRMYQINTIHEAKEFMNFGTYYKTMLVKYENRASVLKDDVMLEKLDDYTEFEHDFKADELANELLDAVKDYNDTTNKDVDRQNSISEQDLTVDNTSIIKWSYDYTKLEPINASSYDVTLTANLYAISFWFTVTNFTDKLFSIQKNNIDIFALTYDKELKSFKVKLTNTLLIVIENVMTGIEQIEESTRYGFLLNYSINTEILTCTIVNSELEIIQELVLSNIKLQQFQSLKFYGQTTIANIRISKTTVIRSEILKELAKLLPEPSKYYLIDNAVPSISE